MSELKIALVGSAPASCRLAPYQDPNWQIWGCSPGLYGVAPRVTAWFETHLWEPGQPWFSPEYCQWLSNLPKRNVELFVGGQIPDLPGSIVYPFDEIQAEFDPQDWFCSSSLWWMMALAIKRGATTIGLWGIDMAAGEEYEMQRAGIHFLTYVARARGIEVGVPHESDLFTPRFRYGAHEWTHSFRKTRARQWELQQRKRDADALAKAKAEEATFLAGALDDLNYMHQTWADKRSHIGPEGFPMAFGYSGHLKDVPDTVPPGFMTKDELLLRESEAGNMTSGKAWIRNQERNPVKPHGVTYLPEGKS